MAKTRELATACWDYEKVKEKYSDTHLFDDVQAVMNDEAVPDVFDIQDAAGVTEAVKVWIKKDDSDLAFSLVSEPYKEICEDLFQKEITDSHFDDPFRSAEGKDLIEYIAGESRLNPYTDTLMHILRQDTHFIGTYRMLSALVTSGSQGLIENALYGDRLHLSLALQKIAVLHGVNKQKNIELDAPPLFKDQHGKV